LHPHSALTTIQDPDYKYSRFQFLHIQHYQDLLRSNKQELQNYQTTDPVERFFCDMAMQHLTTTWHDFQASLPQETDTERHYKNPTSGMYVQDHLERLADSSASGKDADSDNDQQNNQESPAPVAKHAGASHLDSIHDSVQFYQSSDGQLVFLNGFCMSLLLQDYGKCRSEQKPPLPDTIRATVLEIQNIHLTPQIRKRMAFLSHIPLYTDVVLVELVRLQSD